MRTKALVWTAALLLAGVPLFAAVDMFMKIDSIRGPVQGESKDPAHSGWIDIRSLEWGVASPTHATGQAASSHPHDFTITKLLDKTSPRLSQMAMSGEHIKDVTLEIGGQRRLLQDAMITSLRQIQMGNGVGEQVTFSYAKDATYGPAGGSSNTGGESSNKVYLKYEGKVFPKVEQPNGMMALGGAGGAEGAITLQEVRFLGGNRAVIAIREGSNGLLLPAVQRARGSRQKLPQLVVSGYQTGGSGAGEHKSAVQTFTFHDATVVGLSSGGGFTEITLSFSRFDGPMTGFRNAFLK